MRDSVLAAAELLQAQVEDVLARLLTWYEANKAAWDARRGAVGAAKRELGEAGWRCEGTGATRRRAGREAEPTGGREGPKRLPSEGVGDV